ncbi:MAG: thiol reductase thioredoxin [Thermoleophilia bacterium]|nr:thiol reductase thioredoxin [Thermoleophilia bacterium]
MISVVQFTAPWCGPCKPVARALAELAPSFPEVAFAEIDVDADVEAGVRHDVLVLPTVLVLRDGEVIARLDGARGRDDYERTLREVVPAVE